MNRFTRSWKKSWRICEANIRIASGAPHNTMDQRIFQKIAQENPKTTIRLPHVLYNKQTIVKSYLYFFDLVFIIILRIGSISCKSAKSGCRRLGVLFFCRHVWRGHSSGGGGRLKRRLDAILE